MKKITGRFKLNELVWFTKLMVVCDVVKIYKDGYTVKRLDNGKKLFVTEGGLKQVKTRYSRYKTTLFLMCGKNIIISEPLEV